MVLEKTYEAKKYEDAIYAAWEKSGLFSLKRKKGSGRIGGRSSTKATRPFTIMMPPPNATGTLHLGHAVMLALEDIMTRFARMQGKEALWVPGTDHAAIATE